MELNLFPCKYCGGKPTEIEWTPILEHERNGICCNEYTGYIHCPKCVRGVSVNMGEGDSKTDTAYILIEFWNEMHAYAYYRKWSKGKRVD
jgi:hypothetical protein